MDTWQVNVPALLAELEEEHSGGGEDDDDADDGDSDDNGRPEPIPRPASAGKVGGSQQWPSSSSGSAAAVLMEKRSSAPMKEVSLRTMGICLSCYLLVGLAGYRDAPSSPNGNLLKNYCIIASPYTHRGSNPRTSGAFCSSLPAVAVPCSLLAA